MKKVLSLTLALVMLLSLFSASVFAADPDGSKANPYPIARPIDVPTQIEVAAGSSVYYQFPALKFNGWELSAMNATAVEVNGEKVAAPTVTYTADDLAGDGLMIKKGKKVFHRAQM